VVSVLSVGTMSSSVRSNLLILSDLVFSYAWLGSYHTAGSSRSLVRLSYDSNQVRTTNVIYDAFIDALMAAVKPPVCLGSLVQL
jgi:hypothetical protein